MLRRCLIAALCFAPLAAPFAPAGDVASRRMGSTARTRPVVAKEPEYIFELSAQQSRLSFGCRQQTVTMVRPEGRGSLQEFVRTESTNIVLSSWRDQCQPVPGTDDEFVIK
jgi:hypothetical protein